MSDPARPPSRRSRPRRVGDPSGTLEVFGSNEQSEVEVDLDKEWPKEGVRVIG